MSALLEIALTNAIVAGLLALLAAGVGRLGRRPALAHALWLLVLLKLLTPPIIQVPVASLWVAGNTGSDAERQAAQQRPATDRPSKPNEVHAGTVAEWDSATQPADPLIVPEDPLMAAASAPVPSTLGAPTADTGSVEPLETGGGSAAAQATVVFNLRRLVVPFLAIVWITGSILIAILAVVRIARFQRMLKHGAAAPAWLVDEVERLAGQIGLKRVPATLLVPDTVSPLLWSLGGKPQIILPEGLLARMDRQQREAILLHELCHLRRRDNWVRLLELAAGCCYWWHPAVWWARREIQWSEEACCDAWVVWHMSGGGRPYANALLAMVDFLADSQPAVHPVASGFGRVESLKRRLTMIMQGDTPRRLTGAGRLAVLSVAMCSLPLWPTIGQEPATEPQTTATENDGSREGSQRPASAAVSKAAEEQSVAGTTKRVSEFTLPEPIKFEEASTGLSRNVQTIRSIAFSNDGRLLAAAHGSHGTEGTVRIWDMQQRKEIAVWEEPKGIYSVHISPDRRLVVYSILDDNMVKIRAIESGEEVLKIAMGGAPARVRFSPDGKTFVTATTKGSLKLWDAKEGNELKSLASLAFNLQCVAFSRDGKRIVAGGGPFGEDRFGWAGVWDISSGNQIAEMKDMPDSVLGIAISPDGKLVATAGRDRVARLWRAETGKLVSTLSGHQSVLEWADFSSDGKVLATGSYDHTAKLWEVDSGREVATLQGHSGVVMSTRFSPDGETLATAGEGGFVRLWNLDSQEQIAVLEPEATIRDAQSAILSIACSPDGSTIASAHQDKTVRLRDYRTGKLRRVLSEDDAEVSCVAFSPDSKILAMGSCDNTVELWEVAGKGEPMRLEGHTDWVLSVAFAPDGKTVASGSRDNTIRLWDLETGKEKAVLEGHAQMVRCLAFSPDGKMLASGSTDETVRLWDVQKQSEISKLDGRFGGALAFSPDGKTLASAGGAGAIILRDIETGNEQQMQSRHRGGIWCLAFSPRGRTLAAGTSDGTVVFCDPDSAKERDASRGHSEPVTSMAFLPDTSALVSGSSDGTLKFWRARPPAFPPIATLPATDDKNCRFVTFSRDGKWLIAGGITKIIKVWDMQTGEVSRLLEGHDCASTCAAISPDGKVLATGTYAGRIFFWDVASGDRIGELATGLEYSINIDFSPDGTQLAVATWSKAVSVWDLKSKRNLWTSDEQSLPVLSVAFSPDGKTLATTTGHWQKREELGEAKLWDAATGKELATLPGHTDMIDRARFSPDGRLLLTACADSRLRIWDVQTRRLVSTITAPNSVQRVIFSPGGKSVVTGQYGGSLLRWDLDSGELLSEYEGPADRVSIFGLCRSPDGSLLATATLDGMVRLWPTVVPASPDAQTSADIVLGWSNEARYPKDEH